jgi:hypothetical protein
MWAVVKVNRKKFHIASSIVFVHLLQKDTSAMLALGFNMSTNISS